MAKIAISRCSDNLLSELYGFTLNRETNLHHVYFTNVPATDTANNF